MWDNIRSDLKKLGADVSNVIRHTCQTRLSRGGLDLLRRKEWAGHSDPKITVGRYVHLMPSNLTEGIDFLTAILGSNPPSPVIVISTDAGAN